MTPALDPVAAAERWLAPVRLETTPVLFVIGLGQGHLLEVLDRRGWTGHVIALEPDATTATRYLNRKATCNWQVAGRLTVLTGPDYTGLDQAVSALPLATEKPVIAGNPEVARLHREACVHAARMVSRAWFGARANDEARRQNAGRYLLNTLRNLPSIASEGDATSLVGAFAGVPALVVAAGPSLDRNLPEIVTLRDRALLIAVDTALRPLLAAGVQPDFVVAVDPSEANACHLTDLPPCPETHFVAEGSIDPEAVRQFEGRTFFFRVAGHHPWPWLRGLDLDRQLLRAWGSVLTTAFDLALQMGCEPIVFAGADLAFTGGRPYARGTTYEEGWRREQAWGHTLEETWAKRLDEWPETLETGVAGGLVRTAPHLRSFRDWIVTEAGKSGRAIVNATEGGILVGGTIQQSTLVDVLSRHSPLSLTVRSAGAALHGARAPRLATPAISPETRREWMSFAGVTAEAIDEVFRPNVLRAVQAAPAAIVASPAPPPERRHPGLSDADRAYLSDFAQRETLRLVVLANPEQDLLADITRQAQDLAANDAIVIVDELGIAVGAQVRRAVDAILCKRPDLWLEYRRFVDHASRLTVLRGGADRHALPPADADRAKRDPKHQAVADSLVPLIVKQLAPASVVDVGCGAGFWLKALSANGVTDVHGITPVAPVPGLGRRFDVCLCLEVAQHLAPDAHDALIEACTTLSDVVVFSSRAPGAPDGSPHDRPLPYWAAAFLRCGFILEDTLRPAIEQRWGFPRTVFDCLVAFRRAAAFDRESAATQALGEASLAAAQRIHDSYMQAIWWAVLAADRDVSSATPAQCPRSPMSTWTIPPWRLLASGDGTRLFRFRTEAARWYLTHQGRSVALCEDGRAMAAHDLVASVAAAAGGGWVLWRDEITLKASDGTDPRTNGRRYTIDLPTHVAWAESQPPARSIHDGS